MHSQASERDGRRTGPESLASDAWAPMASDTPARRTEPLRVLLFCEKWESGGVEAFLTSLIEAWEPGAVQVSLAACKVQAGQYDARLRACGVAPHALGTGIRQVRSNLRAFRALLEQGRFDAVHLNVYEALALVFAREARRAGVPRVVVHSHNDDLRPSATRTLKLALHRACRMCLGGAADVRLAPSQQAGRFMFGNRPFTVVHNGIDPERFAFDARVRAARRAELGYGEGELVLGCVGRLCEQKNQLFLLEVLAALGCGTDDPACADGRPAARPDRLLLVGIDDGDGSYEARLRARAQELGVSGSVTFFGATSDIAALYQVMDVLCMPSAFEALGIVAVEAQAAGLPVLASPRVPAEAAAGGAFSRLPLDAAPWADAARAAVTPDADRAGGPERVRAAGYDMAHTASQVLQAYATP